jgi:hypothetical protein
MPVPKSLTLATALSSKSLAAAINPPVLQLIGQGRLSVAGHALAVALALTGGGSWVHEARPSYVYPGGLRVLCHPSHFGVLPRAGGSFTTP